jgi:hypothetical protein
MRNEQREMELIMRHWDMDDLNATRYCAWDDHCAKRKTDGTCPNANCSARNVVFGNGKPQTACAPFYEVLKQYLA